MIELCLLDDFDHLFAKNITFKNKLIYQYWITFSADFSLKVTAFFFFLSQLLNIIRVNNNKMNMALTRKFCMGTEPRRDKTIIV